MDFGLQGKRAVVLASTSGLGLASARALLEEGAWVAVSGRDPGRLDRALTELRSIAKEHVFGDSLDVTEKGSLLKHLDLVKAKWGGIDILVTNAGGPPATPASEITDEIFDQAVQKTMKSAIWAIHYTLPGMIERRWGRIVAMTSISVRQPIPELTLSNSLRAGLTGYLKSLAEEVGPQGVLVNSICTGKFETDRLADLLRLRASRNGTSSEEETRKAIAGIPLRRFGRPEEFGAFVAFLASEKASYFHGAAIPIDGGASRSLF